MGGQTSPATRIRWKVQDMSKARGSQRVSHRTRTKVVRKQEPLRRESAALLRELQKLAVDKANRCRNLSAIHRAGQLIRDLRDTQGKSTYGKRWILALASQINPEWEAEDRSLRGFLYRAREFAKWPEDEVARLAAAKRKTRAGKSESLSWEYVWRMLSVSDPARRAELIERWRKQEFSLRAWDREIQQLHGIRFLGRPPARPENLAEAIRQTETMARRWKMWFQNNLASAGPAGAQKAEQGDFLEEFPAGLKRLLKQAMPIIEEIQKKARLAWHRLKEPEETSASKTRQRRGGRRSRR